MDGTREHHPERGQPSSEDQKLWTLALGQMQQCGWTGTTLQGESTYG
jgi:hypothetical protein